MTIETFTQDSRYWNYQAQTLEKLCLPVPFTIAYKNKIGTNLTKDV